MRRTDRALADGRSPSAAAIGAWPIALGATLVVAAGAVAGAGAAGPWVWRLAVGLAVTAVAAAGCAVVVWRARRRVAGLRRMEEAEDRFVAVVDDQGAHAALAAAVDVLLPHGRLAGLHLGDSSSLPAGLAGVLVADALATGLPAMLPDGTTGRETARLVALPIAGGGRRIGALLLRLRNDSDAGVQDVQRLLQRVGPLLAATGEPAAATSADDATSADGATSSDDATSADGELRELVARGAHDLRTPLNTLSGMVDTLVRHDDELPSSTRRELHAALQRSTRRVASWVTILLDAAMDEDARPTHSVPTPLQPLLEEAVTVTRAATAGLRVDVVETGLYVFADPGSVVRVVSNLLANAGHHAGPSDSVEVEARERGREVEVIVRDHGAGWDPDADPGEGAGNEQKHLSGLGLGLVSVRAQVEGWGGELELEETPGGGATVRFTLPGARAGARRPDGGDAQRHWTIAGGESLVRDLHRTS